MNKIRFNKAPVTGDEESFIMHAIQTKRLSGDNEYCKKCQNWFETKLNCKRALLTPSCTAALEMAAMLIDIQKGDEIIMPSYTFVSTANAFVLRGAKIVFVDIRPDTMNIDELKIEDAITSKTKAIVPVHYAGVSCEMDIIMQIASKYGLYVIEDAAQAMMGTYKGKPLGTIGNLGTYSFHETKNYTSGGEGGLLIINDENFIEQAEVIREKGTNRTQFFNGLTDKYTWINKGSSYLMNEISAAYLLAQLKHADKIKNKRMENWSSYYENLEDLQTKGLIMLPSIPSECEHNAHMFYIKTHTIYLRKKLINYLNCHNINAVFHYIPLHTAPAGKRYGRFHGNDIYTTKESEKLIRLPLFFDLSQKEILYVKDKIYAFFAENTLN